MNFQFDFFNGLSAVATALGAYAAWRSYKTSKKLDKLQDLKVDVKFKDIAYEKVPDTHWHSIKLQVTNLSTIASFVKKMYLELHGKKYELRFDEAVVLQPFTPTEICCTLGSCGRDVLDGRYSATIILETDRKTITCQFDEVDFVRVFHHVPTVAK